MATTKPSTIWSDIKQYRRAYLLTAVTSFGGMLFGWDTGLIGGVLTMKSFQNSFDLNSKSAAYANLSGNIVSVLQAGCFFGAMASFYLSDKLGRKTALIVADIIFLIGSILQTTSGLNTTSLAQLYVGRVIGGFGVGLISGKVVLRSVCELRADVRTAVVPTYIGENANKEIRGRCIGTMQLFKYVSYDHQLSGPSTNNVIQRYRYHDLLLRQLRNESKHLEQQGGAMEGAFCDANATRPLPSHRHCVSE